VGACRSHGCREWLEAAPRAGGRPGMRGQRRDSPRATGPRRLRGNAARGLRLNGGGDYRGSAATCWPMAPRPRDLAVAEPDDLVWGLVAAPGLGC